MNSTQQQEDYQSWSDEGLISEYLKHSSDIAFKVLLDRYYKMTTGMIARAVGPASPDIEDLVQNTWIKLINNLGNYRDEGKFGAYIATITKNTITDHWRRKGIRSGVELSELDEETSLEEIYSDSTDVSQDFANQKEMEYLVSALIPALPCEQRIVFLLKHESEYWEHSKRLEWDHLAVMNGIEVDEAWARFDHARHDLKGKQGLGCEKEIIFYVWTQAQRPAKQGRYTEAYFSDLLDIPVNTLKTRYRAACKALADGLSDWQVDDA